MEYGSSSTTVTTQESIPATRSTPGHGPREKLGILRDLERIGYRRQESQPKEKRVRLLYFNWLAKKLRKESEELPVPASVADVDSLLLWLGRRKPGAAPLFGQERVRVTLNKQFAEGFSKTHDGDEVGIVPTCPTAPATPDLL
jgi:molybdopterin converting factor small subunit